MIKSETDKIIGKVVAETTIVPIGALLPPMDMVSIHANQTATEQADVLAEFLLNRTDKFQDIADFLSVLSLNIVKGLSNRSKKLILEAENINQVIEIMTKQKIKI